VRQVSEERKRLRVRDGGGGKRSGACTGRGRLSQIGSTRNQDFKKIAVNRRRLHGREKGLSEKKRRTHGHSASSDAYGGRRSKNIVSRQG